MVWSNLLSRGACCRSHQVELGCFFMYRLAELSARVTLLALFAVGICTCNKHALGCLCTQFICSHHLEKYTLYMLAPMQTFHQSAPRPPPWQVA